MKKIILFSNTSWSLYNFRINLIKELIAKNYKVIILSNRDYTTKKLIDLGCSFYKIKLDRRGDNFLKEFITLFNIYKKIKLISPNFIFNFTIKPIIYGSLSSRILNIKTLNTLDGLGATFEINIFKIFVLKYLIKISQKKVKLFYFVNLNDLNIFLSKNYLKKSQTKLINGTGIDLNFFKFKKNKFSKKINFLLIARLLYSKGVIDYLEAAEKLSKKFKNKCSFTIAGIVDKEIKDHIPKKILEKKVKNSKTKIYYNVRDVRRLILKSNCVVLPTNYNEGLPRSLLEAAAMGRPIITTNLSGCKRVGKNNYNALIYSKLKQKHLLKMLTKFLLLKTSKKIYMSINSYKIAKKFDEVKIINKYKKFLNHG